MRIVPASVNNKQEYRVYDNQEIIARFTQLKHAETFIRRTLNRAFVLVNEDNDVVCVYDSEPTIEEIKDQLEESYSMDLQVYELTPRSIYAHYEVRGDNFFEIVQITNTRLL